MTRRNVRIYLNHIDSDHFVKKMFGTPFETKPLERLYRTMTKAEFLKLHPEWKDECKKGFRIFIEEGDNRLQLQNDPWYDYWGTPSPD